MTRRYSTLLFSAAIAVLFLTILLGNWPAARPAVLAAPAERPAAAARGAAVPDICYDFESGTLPADFSAETTTNGSATGRVEVVDLWFLNLNGSYSLKLDTNCATTAHSSCVLGNNTRQAAVLEANLGGASDVALSFNVKRIYDDFDVEDGVFLSDDSGSSYTKVFDFQTVPASYTSYTSVLLDISSLASSNGLTLNNGFLIKFQGVDDEIMYELPSLYDGYGLDNICICQAPATPGITAQLVGSDLVVSWASTGALQYEIWSGINDLSFSPGSDCDNPGPGQSCALTTSTTYTITDVLVHPDFTYNVSVRSRNACGQTSADGTGAIDNNQMMFTFPMTDTFGADLSVNMTVSEANPALGSLDYTAYPLTYTIQYTNESRFYTAASPILTYTFDVDGSLDSAASTAGWSQVGSSDIYTLALGALGPGAGGTATLVMDVNGSTAQYTNPQIQVGDAVGGDPYLPNSAGTAASVLGVTIDSDGDGLPNWVETNTNTFLSPLNTGTDPNNPDSDGDAINDGDEVRGTNDGLLLMPMGVNPLRKNILLEYDWFDDANECAAHSHQPNLAAVQEVSGVFAAANVSNPDGSTGVTLIHDYGQGGAFTGGNLVSDADGVIAGGVSGSDFLNIKAAYFDPRRQGYFHYVLLPHRYNTSSSSSGQAELPGNDMIVSLYCAYSDHNVAHTIMHELGHNIGLRHGGDVDTNYKPNYNSVMNYEYQFPGIDSDCNVTGNGILNFSNGTNISLNENSLNESAGVCGVGAGVTIDWNNNSVLGESGVVADINNGDGIFEILNDYNDWANIVFTGLANADGLPVSEQEIITDQPVPAEFLATPEN